MGAILQQRGIILLHGSCCKNGKAFVITGDKGFAKTDMLMRNLYRAFMVGDKEGRSSQLKTCVKLGEQIRCLSVLILL